MEIYIQKFWHPWIMDARGFQKPSVHCTLRSRWARRHATHIKQVLRGNHGHVRRQNGGANKALSGGY